MRKKCKHNLIIHITGWCLLVCFLSMPLFVDGATQVEAAIQNLDWLLKSMNQYEKRFQIHTGFLKKWQGIKTRIDRLKSQIGIDIAEENIGTAREQIGLIRAEIEGLLLRQSRLISSIFRNQGNNLSGLYTLDPDWVGNILFSEAGGISGQFISGSPTKAVGCEKDRERFAVAFRTESNANFYRRGSENFSRAMVKAIELFYQISRSKCLPEKDDMAVYAKQFVSQRKGEITEIIKQIKSKRGDPKEREALMASIHPDEVKIFLKLDRKWYDGLEIEKDFFLSSPVRQPRAQTPSESDAPASRSVVKKSTSSEPGKGKPTQGQTATTGPVKFKAGKPGALFPLSLDVWQSAWGDFGEIGDLIRYLRKNNIRKINLNPGLPMGPKFYAEGYKKFKPLVKKFYEGGVKKISFLYAELNYPIGYFAQFLRNHPDLGIDTIVDDSEFVDIFKSRFEKNIREVKRWGIKYSAFVTLESSGNSGVSDNTRYWVLDHVDYPILMSYFGCSLSVQKEKLAKYLAYADRRGIRRRVGVAILMGSKKVGREISCELLLSKNQIQRFLRDLHLWALKNHPSYGGIVLETNLRMPKVDIFWDIR